MDAHLFRLLVAAALIIVAGSSPVMAQNFERYRPKDLTLPPQWQPLPDQPAAAAKSASDAVLVDSLDALIVLDSGNKVDPHNAFDDEQGVRIEFDSAGSLIHSAGMSRILNAQLGKPITLRQLNELSREIIDYYRRCGQPVVDVQIPEQKITAGTVQIVVVEGRVGQIKVFDCDPEYACRVRQQIEYTCPGGRIYESSLEEDLYWLNRYPFHHVDLALEPGATEGDTDIHFKVNRVTPIRGYVGYEDTGVKSLGLERLFAGVIIGDPFGWGGTLGYQYTSDGYFDLLSAHAVSYSKDFNRDWSLLTYGSWASVTPNMPAPMNQNGESWQTGLGVSRYLQRSYWNEQALNVGVDFKTTNNNLEFGGQGVQAGEADLIQLNFGYDRLRRYRNGDFLAINHDVYVGPGSGFSSHSNAGDFNTIRANTDPSYIYYVGRLMGRWELPRQMELQTRFAGQIASDRLLYSEMLGFGGYDSVRGYDQRTLNADGGWLWNVEVGPEAWLSTHCRDTRSLRTYAFADMGTAYVRAPVAGESGDQFISSVGIGARYAISNRLTARADYGWGLNSIPGANNRSRVHLGLVAQFGPVPRSSR